MDEDDYCINNQDIIYDKAQLVYKIGCNKNHRLCFFVIIYGSKKKSHPEMTLENLSVFYFFTPKSFIQELQTPYTHNKPDLR